MSQKNFTSQTYLRDRLLKNLVSKFQIINKEGVEHNTTSSKVVSLRNFKDLCAKV